MKIYFFFLFLLHACLLHAQVEYEISKDPKHPEVTIYRGTIDKYLLQSNAEFNKWYVLNQKDYLPDSSVLNVMVKAKENTQFVLFGGTWCDDSQFILPKFSHTKLPS